MKNKVKTQAVIANRSQNQSWYWLTTHSKCYNSFMKLENNPNSRPEDTINIVLHGKLNGLHS